MKRLHSLSYKTLFTILFFGLAGIVFFLKIGGKTTKVSAAWWNDSWHYRKSISINNTGSTQSNVYLTISTDTSDTSKFQNDCGDIRFTDQNSSLLNYYIVSGCGTNNTSIHINFPSLVTGTSSIYLYYGNSSADNGFSASDFSTAATNSTPTPQSEETGGGPIAYWKFDNNELGDNYTQLNYITINNDATNGYFNSINTGVTYSSATKLEFTLKSTDTTASMVLVSGYVSSNTRDYPCILGSGGNIAPSSFTTSTLTPSNITRAQISDGNIRTFTLNFTSSSNYPISFGAWIDSVWSRTVDWYSFKIWNGNTLIRNLVPAKRNSDSVVGFYDTVNNVFYTNAGAGSFTAGTTAAYDSIGNNNGTLLGTTLPEWQTGNQCISGKCLNFNGSNNYLKLPTINNIRSISMWTFIRSGQTVWNYLFDARTGLGGGYFADGGIGGNWTKMYINGVGQTVNWANIPKDQWVHLYVESNTLFSDDINLMSRYTNDEYLSGKLDEVKFFNYPLTDSQIQADYQSGLSYQTRVKMGLQSNTGPDLNSSLIAYWKFDENNGTSVYDSSGNSLTGTFGTGNSAPTWSTGKFGVGNSFDGNDYVTLPLIHPDNLTYSAWIKTSQTTNGIVYCTNYGNASTCWHGGLKVSSTGKAVMDIGYPLSSYRSVTGNITINDNKWHHLVMTSDSTGSFLYVDGVLDTSSSYYVGQVPGSSEENTTIGSRKQYNYSTSSWEWNNPFQGLIDEVKVYNRALTANEIKQDYNQGSAIQFGSTNQTIGGTTTSLDYCLPGDTSYCASPIAEWKFDEGIGTSITDTSGNNKTAILSGSNTSIWTQGKIGKAANFNGTNNFYETSSAINFGSNSFTIETWYKSPGVTSTYNTAIISNYKDATTPCAQLHIYGTSDASAGKAFINIRDASGNNNNIYSTNRVDDGLWHHLAAVRDTQTGNIYLYVDGKLDKPGVGTSNVGSVDSGQNIILGSGHLGRFTVAQMDQARIYNYARTPAQIAYDYNKGAPVGWWKLDECQGNIAYDWSGVGNTGVINIGSSGSQNSLGTCTVGTSAAWTNGAVGKINSSLNFDGTDDRISIGNPSSLQVAGTKNFSVAAWVYATQNKCGREGIDKAGNTLCGLNTRGGWSLGGNSTSLGFHVSDSTNTQYRFLTFTSQLNTWYHLVGVRNGNNLYLYVNGKLTQTGDVTGFVIDDTNNLSIGGNTSSAWLWPGQLDDVRIYNYALTSEQIKNIYNGGAVNFQ
ncbi:MAG: DUF2341 domain-containing protein [Candidatus Shapirobacteria bacterium]|nr:DUF2341 domain-containing protein [Candidatus Shapirobacteria bacterium]